jgi:arginase
LLKADSKFQFTEVPVESCAELEIENDILGYRQILSLLQIARAKILSTSPDRIFTLGGSCGIETLPVSYLNHKYGGDLAVVWLDAHADLNTPESSLSKHFHGMPLRTLLGEGDRHICEQSFSILRADQIFLAGTRELDLAESELIKNQKISIQIDLSKRWRL